MSDEKTWFSDPRRVTVGQRAQHWDLGTSEMVTGRSLHFPLVIALEGRSHVGFVTLPLASSTMPGIECIHDTYKQSLEPLCPQGPHREAGQLGQEGILGSQATHCVTVPWVPRLTNPSGGGSTATLSLSPPGHPEPSSWSLPPHWLQKPRLPILM